MVSLQRTDLEPKIKEFITRRFPIDCHWLDGNCFFFAQILKARFGGDIVYDPIDGHFLLLAHDNQLYDWAGLCFYTAEQRHKMFLWDSYLEDPLLRQRIMRDCIK